MRLTHAAHAAAAVVCALTVLLAPTTTAYAAAPGDTVTLPVRDALQNGGELVGVLAGLGRIRADRVGCRGLQLLPGVAGCSLIEGSRRAELAAAPTVSTAPGHGDHFGRTGSCERLGLGSAEQ